MMQLVFVSGLSGAGKTVALRQHEDLGFFCIDNIPLDLLEPLIERTLRSEDPRYRRLALGIDARARPSEIADFPRYFETLRGRGVDARVLFLTAEEDALLRRYNDTRRKHPLAGRDLPLPEAIALEHQLLRPIADIADQLVDTTHMNLHELRAMIHARLPDAAAADRMAVLFLSFGYKNGIPDGADFIFDARCLRNPHWVPELRTLSGRDEAVAKYLEADPLCAEWYADVQGYLARWLPRFQLQDRSYITIAIGCTGGQHRSVYLAERLGRDFRERFPSVSVRHREMSA